MHVDSNCKRPHLFHKIIHQGQCIARHLLYFHHPVTDVGFHRWIISHLFESISTSILIRQCSAHLSLHIALLAAAIEINHLAEGTTQVIHSIAQKREIVVNSHRGTRIVSFSGSYSGFMGEIADVESYASGLEEAHEDGCTS